MQAYIIGSLRNPEIPGLARELRKAVPGMRFFDDWYSAGERADDHLWEYEKQKGHGAIEALAGPAAQNVFNFDKKHIDASDIGILVLPAGKSGHLELGYMLGKGKRGYILIDGEPERIDVMYNFATRVFSSFSSLAEQLKMDWAVHANQTALSDFFIRHYGTYGPALYDDYVYKRSMYNSPPIQGCAADVSLKVNPKYGRGY